MDSSVPRLKLCFGLIDIELFDSNDIQEKQNEFKDMLDDDRYMVIGQDITNQAIYCIDKNEDNAIYAIYDKNLKYMIASNTNELVEILDQLEEFVDDTYSKILTDLDTEEEIEEEEIINFVLDNVIEIIQDISEDCDIEYWQELIRAEILERIQQ